MRKQQRTSAQTKKYEYKYSLYAPTLTIHARTAFGGGPSLHPVLHLTQTRKLVGLFIFINLNLNLGLGLRLYFGEQIIYTSELK